MKTGMEEMVFIGYRMKKPWVPVGDWSPVELVCSVGEDLCEPQKDWFQHWDFNQGFCYNTPEEAKASLGGDFPDFKLFAYFIYPYYLYSEEPPEKLLIEELLGCSFASLPSAFLGESGFTELGFDVAEYNQGVLGYPYSPLVTNGFMRTFPVNKYGLRDSLKGAISACKTINLEMPEHGNHWVFRVFGQLW